MIRTREEQSPQQCEGPADSDRCDAASDHTHTMQNTEERGANGAADTETETVVDTWATINSLVKQVGPKIKYINYNMKN